MDGRWHNRLLVLALFVALVAPVSVTAQGAGRIRASGHSGELDGQLEIPDRPGLGITVDEGFVRRHARG